MYLIKQWHLQQPINQDEYLLFNFLLRKRTKCQKLQDFEFFLLLQLESYITFVTNK